MKCRRLKHDLSPRRPSAAEAFDDLWWRPTYTFLFFICCPSAVLRSDEVLSLQTLSPLVKHRLCRKSLQRREAACNLKTVEVIWHLHRDELVMMRTRLNSTLKLVYWLSGNKAWCIDPLMVTGALPDRALDITDPVSREFKTSTVCGSSFLPVKDKKKIQI